MGRIVETLLDGSTITTETPDPVPEKVTNYQARKALRAAGKLAAVDAAVKAAGGDVLDAWEYANEFFRADPIVAALGAAVGMTDAEIDMLFRTASTIA